VPVGVNVAVPLGVTDGVGVRVKVGIGLAVDVTTGVALRVMVGVGVRSVGVAVRVAFGSEAKVDGTQSSLIVFSDRTSAPKSLLVEKTRFTKRGWVKPGSFVSFA
jgi:hypothetical protein